MNFKEHLQSLTQQAEAAEAQKKEVDLQQDLLMRLQLVQQAESMCLGLKDRLEEAARDNKRRLTVMKLTDGYGKYPDYTLHGQFSNEISYANLGIKAMVVYDYCKNELGLTPEIMYTHDGIGISSWFEMVVKWE